MWDGQEVFEITVTVDGKLFDREIAPLHNKVTIQRKEPAKDEQKGSTKKTSKQ